jgi:hypothetical protein
MKGTTMTRVSDINITDETKRIAVETPTDSCRLLYSERERELYIAEFGDVEVEYDTYYKRYAVPAHTHQRLAYIALKAAHCTKWGSN